MAASHRRGSQGIDWLPRKVPVSTATVSSGVSTETPRSTKRAALSHWGGRLAVTQVVASSVATENDGFQWCFNGFGFLEVAGVTTNKKPNAGVMNAMQMPAQDGECLGNK